MLRVTQLILPLDHDHTALAQAVARRLGIKAEKIEGLAVHKRTPDARQRNSIKLVYAVNVVVADEAGVLERCSTDPKSQLAQTVRAAPDTSYEFVVPRAAADSAVGTQARPVVVGLGPCGLFAGLLLAQMGLRPLILERGKRVRERTVDTFGFWRKRALDPESNVQFGEGGAGTFSDGKLYSQVRDPGHRGRKVMEEFVAAGAPKEILWQGRPHIGTFKLVKVVETMRAKIESLGGEIRFTSRVDEVLLSRDEHGNRSVCGVKLEGGEELETNHLVCALGHSARDSFAMLHQLGVAIEPKPFSIGFRVEHPQTAIDACRYGRAAGHERLGAADYRLAHHCKGPGLEGRTVYSFCMCPGGTVVAAASEEGGVVTNGMSQYDRSERNANSGLVVDLQPEDYGADPTDPETALAGIAFQRKLERQAFVAGGSDYNAPGQLIGDFIADRPSTEFGSVAPSYQPGVTLTSLAECMPSWVIDAMREALPAFDRKLPGFAQADAILTGVETRTSSPIRMPRTASFESTNTSGLYPAGEGAGYAGGILSAAIDGIRVAEAVALSIG